MCLLSPSKYHAPPDPQRRRGRAINLPPPPPPRHIPIPSHPLPQPRAPSCAALRCDAMRCGSPSSRALNKKPRHAMPCRAMLSTWHPSPPPPGTPPRYETAIATTMPSRPRQAQRKKYIEESRTRWDGRDMGYGRGMGSSHISHLRYLVGIGKKLTSNDFSITSFLSSRVSSLLYPNCAEIKKVAKRHCRRRRR